MCGKTLVILGTAVMHGSLKQHCISQRPAASALKFDEQNAKTAETWNKQSLYFYTQHTLRVMIKDIMRIYLFKQPNVQELSRVSIQQTTSTPPHLQLPRFYGK